MARKIRRGVRRSVEHGTMVEWVSLEAFMESFEVVSIAYDSARSTAETHARDALNDALGYFQKAPLSAPFRCAVNNTRLTFRLLGDIAEISLETLDDLSQVNQARKDRMRLLSRDARR